MRRTISRLAFAAALAGISFAVAPSASFASASTQTHTYSTVLTQTKPLPSGGAIVGTMRLTVSSDGIINGWYVPEDAGPPVDVTGGKHGSELWLDVGNMGSLRIYGSMHSDGTIAGTATPYPRVGTDDDGTPPSYDFVAKPST